tara:strand:+ start:110 stop:649 length:540 start_codon:yes stop_codon:yes gene_type:complete
MYKGWKRGTRLYVNERPGVIKSKRGDQWSFLYDKARHNTKINPLEVDWYYDIQKPVNRWPGYLSVILIKKNLKPFVYQRESYDDWHGAATERTISADVPVWQIAGTNRLLVGHLGEYRVFSKDGFNVVKKYQKNVWIGTGRPGKTFCSLKTTCPAPAREPTRRISVPLYKTLTRDELGG